MKVLEQSAFEEPHDFASLDYESLVVHHRPTECANDRLLIFVHGLGGRRYGAKATWGQFPRFVYEDFPMLDIGLYAYRTLFGRLKFWKSVPLDTEAQVFADIIRDASDYKTIILAGHSLGGLLCMAAIHHLIRTQQAETVERIRGLILMATPQTGSQRVPRCLNWLSKDFYALRPHGSFVTEIHNTFINTITLEEGVAASRKVVIPTWAVLGASDWWVDHLSARVNLPSNRTKTVHGSHTAIVKPPTKDADAYRFVCERLQVCLQRSVDDAQSAPASPALLGGREEALHELPAWSALKTRLGPKLARVLRQQCGYQEAHDVRHAPEWPQDRPVLLLTGESGQGKTWQLAKLAAIAALEEGLVVLVKVTRDTDDGLSAAADVLGKEGLNNHCSLSMERIAQRRREVVPEWATPWLTVCIDNVQTVRQARDLVTRDWEGLGVRLAMTVPPAVGRSLRNDDDRVHLFEVPDFTSDELRKYLLCHNRHWEAAPEDVRATLRRPLLAYLYCHLAQDASWTPTNEYALFERYWQRIREAHEQADFPHDLGKMQRLVSRILQEHAAYPWPSDVLVEAGIDDQTWKRLEAIGWLRRLEDGRVEIWHDRLLNWAVAEALIAQRKANHLSTVQFGEWLCKFYDRRNVFAGKALAYVPMDILWLASDPQGGLVTDVPELIAALDEHPAYGGNPESLYQTLLPTLGIRVLPALIERVRMTATQEFNLYPQFVAAAFIQIGTQYPKIVQECALQLLKEQLPALQQIGIRVRARLPCAASLDRLWELHKQHVQICSDRQDPQSHLRHFLYEISYAALRACIQLQPQWLVNKIRYANSQEEPVADLAYLMTHIEEAYAARLWREVKTELFAKVAPEKPRSLISCIRRFRDREELPRLVSWLQEKRDFASPTALATLALLDPDGALHHLEEVPPDELYMYTWWLPGLLHTWPEHIRTMLHALIQVPGTDPWSIARVYQGQENAMDADTVDLLLDALARELETYPREGTVHPIPQLDIQLSLLASLSRYELLTRFEARVGSRLEVLLADLACAWVNQGAQAFARELHDTHKVLLKIGGLGLTQLVNCELAHPDYLTRLDGWRWACIRADAETRQHLQTIAASDHLHGNPPFPYEQVRAAYALAVLGDDAAVVDSMLRWGEKAFDDVAAIRRRHPPMEDAYIKKALAALEEQNDCRRAHAILALGISGRQDLIPRLRAIFIQTPAESELALAAILALDELGDKDTETIRRLAIQLDIPAHRLFAWRALLHMDTADAWDALVHSPPEISTQRLDREVQAARAQALQLWRHPPSRELGAKIIWTAMRNCPEDFSWPSAFLEAISDLDDAEVREWLWEEAFPPEGDPRYRGNGRRTGAAIRGLAKFEPEAAFQAAQRALEQMQGPGKELPALLLALDARRAIPILCNHVPKEMKTLTRWAIGRALRLAHPSYLVHTHIEEMLQSSEATIRAAGAELSGWQEDSALQTQLSQLLDDDVSETVHRAALEALERHRNAQEVQKLMAAFPSANDGQRWSLLEAMLRLGDPHLLAGRKDVLWLGKILEGIPMVFIDYAQAWLKERFKEVEEQAKEKDRKPSWTV